MENLRDFAVIGIAARMPEAKNVEQFWSNLLEGRDSVRAVPLSRIKLHPNYDPMKEYLPYGYIDAIDEFDPVFFKIAPNAAKFVDPAHRLLLEIVNDAIEDAGYSREQMSEEKVGVFLGTFYPEYYKYLPGGGLDALTGNTPANFAGRVSYLNGFTGPAMTIDTACSSSLVALHMAIQSLKNEDCDVALVGGANIRIDLAEKRTDNIGILSPSGKCRSFSADSDGVAGGEGVIAILIKPLEKALAQHDNIHAVIKGSAINQDGARSNGIAAPSPEAQKEAILTAWKKAGIDPLTISYIETHGTGTKLGDPIEIGGITGAFREFTEEKQFCPIGTVKTNIGHLDSVAGLAGFLKTVLALKNQTIPPSINFSKPNPYIDFDNSPVYVNTVVRPWQTKPGIPRRAGVSSFGLSGTNAHVILEEAPAVEQQLAESTYVVTLSAPNDKVLVKQVERLAGHLTEHGELQLADISYTLNCGRRHYAQSRMAWVAENTVDLLEKLKAFVAAHTADTDATATSAGSTPTEGGSALEIAALFLLPDYAEGDEHLFTDYLASGMANSEAVARCRALANLEENPRAAFFTFEYALAEHLQSLGIKPQSTVGVGVGEAVSAVLTKRLTLEEGLKKAIAGGGNVEVTVAKLKPFIDGQIAKGRNTLINFVAGSKLALMASEALGVRPGVRFIDAYGAPQARTFNTALSELFIAGVDLHWPALAEGRRVSLPAYPYERKSYWFDIQFTQLRQSLEKVEANPQFEAPALDLELVDYAEIRTLEQIQDMLRKIWQQRLGLEEIELDADFIELGGDSLRGMMLMGDIKKYFGVELDIAYLLEYGNIRALSAVIFERMQNPEAAAVKETDNLAGLGDEAGLSREEMERLNAEFASLLGGGE